MRFELAETTVMASEADLDAKVQEAVDLVSGTTSTVYFEYERTAVEVTKFDTTEALLDRWKVEHNFFGLDRRKRRMLYRTYVEGKLPMDVAAERCDVPVKVAYLYITKKGWKRLTDRAIRV